MTHTEQLGSLAGQRGGWRHEFSRVAALPTDVVIDATRLLPVAPMFLVRLRMFIDDVLDSGRTVIVLPPANADTHAQFVATASLSGLPPTVCPTLDAEPNRSIAVLPLTRLVRIRDIDPLADDVRRLIEYELTDISSLGNATHMAVSELCLNALEHGGHPRGAYVVAQRFTEPRRRVAVAVADAGIGIPNHLRRRYPDWVDDTFAIGRAVSDARVSGTGHPHRGQGLPETLEAALTASLSAARLDIQSARGFLRTEITQGTVEMTPIPTDRNRQGAWITYDLVSA